MNKKFYLPAKRAMDIVLSGGAIVVLSPLLAGISIAIKLDSPGPILFKQKRIGKNKELFEIWKFRSMRTDTPKDMPTHMLNNPDAFITRTGKFLRKTSLDELPQIFNIFVGKMSVIGPRPALWNQDDLVAERDKCGANDVTPGLTGWAQINGRDELEIPVKARFDGEYVEKMGFLMDAKCFLGTIGSVLSHDGVVEGGTGEMKKKGVEGMVVPPEKLNKEIRVGATVVGAAVGVAALGAYALLGKKKMSGKKTAAILLGAGAAATVYTNIRRRVELQDKFVGEEWCDATRIVTGEKKILITGAGSYVGESVKAYLEKFKNDIGESTYKVDTLDMLDESWRECDFSTYDVVYHVAGIAHADVGNVTEEQKALYYKANRDLAVEVTEKAKSEGVKQFIFMSSMIV